ncbi:sulfurtransferase complex subunit TusC [Thalassotalea euphylliae]|uniref:Sulfurtransferase complex subunit TusC n=1 Tax=Thalassotalea euphylliae TaxID=1655234 RepID=A0A3E0UIP0_9GAMM|nr:sulfurtransferase complex subunit TusC [Thalassotalea euphylliae]REL35622.1 sulfurtransferase complex subunit TusC [Thalassotalea euphylliae]
MSSTSLAVINTKAPFATSHGKDALDLALIFGSYEQQISLFFIGDGVFQLLQRCDGITLNVKDFTKTFAALSFYDIENVYVSQESLTKRSLNKSSLIDGVEVLSDDVIQQYLSQHTAALTF